MIILITLAAIGLLAIAATIHELLVDGFRRMPRQSPR